MYALPLIPQLFGKEICSSEQVGLESGQLDVIDLESDSTQPSPSMTAKPCRKKPIHAVSFSPGGEFCAVGGRDRGNLSLSLSLSLSLLLALARSL